MCVCIKVKLKKHLWVWEETECMGGDREVGERNRHDTSICARGRNSQKSKSEITKKEFLMYMQSQIFKEIYKNASSDLYGETLLKIIITYFWIYEKMKKNRVLSRKLTVLSTRHKILYLRVNFFSKKTKTNWNIDLTTNITGK